MDRTSFRSALLATAVLLGGCSFSADALWPSLTGEDPAGKDAQPAASIGAPAPTVVAGTNQPALGTTSFDPVAVSPGAPTGTHVGQKVGQLRGDLQKMQGAITQHNGELQQLRAKTVADSQRYHGIVAAINARLQVGTTKGNPILVQQFNNAQVELERVNGDISMMNQLANKVAEDSAFSSFLLESTQATLGLSGAVDEDHAQLRVLQDETSRTMVQIERMLKEVSEDVRRQTNYVSSERGNLNTLLAGVKSGEILGQSLVNPFVGQGGELSAPAAYAGARRPLVVIRFDQANVNYQQPLYSAISRVLERRPDAAFDVVAVASGAGGQAQASINSGKAKRAAEGVIRSLGEMGLPANRMSLSSQSSAGTTANEVHVYLR